MKFASGLAKWCMVLILVGLVLTGCKKKSVEEYLQQGRVDKAVKYCQDCEGTAQKECFAKLATYFFNIQDFSSAATNYARAGDHARVISSYLIANAISDAEAYCNQLPKENQKEGASILAKSFYLRGNYTSAMLYYKMAGESQKIQQIEAKVPAFKLLDSLEVEVNKYAHSEVRSKITQIKETLKYYIYFDGYSQWRYGTKNQTDKDASALYSEAGNMLHKKVAPVFMENVLNTLATSAWTQERMDLLFFHRARVNRLMGLLKSLDVIGSYRRFYEKYETQLPTAPLPGASGYDMTYQSAIQHGSGLMETVTLSEKSTDPSLFSDYINDLDVDGEVLDYITGMLDNIQARIMELDSRGKNIRKYNTGEKVKTETTRELATFIGACNQVLLKVGNKEYPKANDSLLKAYNLAKQNIKDLEKALDIPQMPGQQ